MTSGIAVVNTQLSAAAAPALGCTLHWYSTANTGPAELAWCGKYAALFTTSGGPLYGECGFTLADSPQMLRHYMACSGQADAPIGLIRHVTLTTTDIEFPDAAEVRAWLAANPSTMMNTVLEVPIISGGGGYAQGYSPTGNPLTVQQAAERAMQYALAVKVRASRNAQGFLICQGRCGQPSQYAEPAADGTFVCYSCRVEM